MILYPSLSPWVCSNSCPLSQWCHPTVSSSVTLFSSSPQSFPGSRAFPMSQLFPSAAPSIGASAAASVLPMNIQGWFPLGLTGLISLLSKGLSKVRGILQERMLEWVAMPSSRGSSQPREQTRVSHGHALQADSLPLSHQGSLDYSEVYLLYKTCFNLCYNFLTQDYYLIAMLTFQEKCAILALDLISS